MKTTTLGRLRKLRRAKLVTRYLAMSPPLNSLIMKQLQAFGADVEPTMDVPPLGASSRTSGRRIFG